MFDTLISFGLFALFALGCMAVFQMLTCEKAPEPPKEHMHHRLNPPCRPMTRAQKQGSVE